MSSIEETNTPASQPNNYWLRSGALTLLEKANSLFFGLITSMILWRHLSKPDMAAWGLFLLVTYTLEMGRSGLIQNGLMRYLAVFRKNPDEFRAVLQASLLLNLGFSILTNAIIWLVMDWFMREWQTPQLANVLPVYFLTNFVMAFFFQFNFVQQANFEFRGIFWSNFFFRGGLFVWVLCCRLFEWPFELQTLAVSMLVSGVLGALASWWFARHFLADWLSKLDTEKIYNRALDLMAYGKYVLGTNLSTMLFKSIDKLVVGKMVGPIGFAEYDVAGKVTQMVEAPSFSMAAVVFPQGAERMESQGREGIKRLYERSVGAVLAIILPFILVVLLFAEPIIRIIAGWQYPESADLLRLTAFFGLFMPFAVQFGTILDSTGRPATNFAYTLGTALLNLVLSYLFVRHYGIYGAAMATLTGYAISFVFAQRLLRREFGVNPLNAFRYIPVFYRMVWNMVIKR
ncbi:MAG: flippase [Saprospiraceae bacterium]|nr:flippase [Saprospiraceae bacterium]